MADSRAASVKCRVTCDEVTLRLTLTDRLLQKSLQDAVVAPFLVAFRKRSQADVRVLRAVEVDGAEVDPGAPAGTVLGGDEPHVVLRPLVPTRPRGDVVAPAGTVQNAIVEDDEGRHSRAPHASSPGTQTVAGPDAMDMSQLSGMLKGMQHLLPPDLRKRAEQLTPEQVSVGLKLQAPPSNVCLRRRGLLGRCWQPRALRPTSGALGWLNLGVRTWRAARRVLPCRAS